MIKNLPSDVRSRVEEWTTSLEATLGEDLVGILVHGSVARGEYRPGESDVDAIVVLLAPGEVVATPWTRSRFDRGVEAWISGFPGMEESFVVNAESRVPGLPYVVLRRRGAPPAEGP